MSYIIVNGEYVDTTGMTPKNEVDLALEILNESIKAKHRTCEVCGKCIKCNGCTCESDKESVH